MGSPSYRGEALSRDLDLDLEVALRIEGYRWVEWKHGAMAEAPLDEPGRFVGHPGDLLAHLYQEARPGAPLHIRPYTHLPCYSLEAGPALRASERAGVFGGEGARLSCSRDGTWRILCPGVAEDRDECLPRLLARVALARARTAAPGEAP